ncbi:MAG: hypothetical protein AUH85_05920 [Chloroflexi bacterium 13_1_40CM_4_68_4]|nr:MAG: hypothetical protein AUH85_05920 [Chloroflexi bacterium 13_1_40CM_4_68_4]
MMPKTNPFKSSSSSETARANHKLWLEHALAENRRELERLVATLHDDCVYEVVPSGLVFTGKDEVRNFYRGLWEGIPDVKLDLLNRIDADDCIVEQSEVYGTMSGALFGFPPSGKPVRFKVVIFFPVRDGKFVGERVYFDAAEIARQVPGAAGQLRLAR